MMILQLNQSHKHLNSNMNFIKKHMQFWKNIMEGINLMKVEKKWQKCQEDQS